jgi:hypothetical protein
MTSLLSSQVELSNGRAVYLKPAEQGAPQVRASLTNLMMTPIACLIRAAQGAPRAPRRLPRHLHTSPSSHLAIFTPRHLHTSPRHSSRSPRCFPPPPSRLFTRAHSQTRLSFTPGGRWSIRAPTQPKKITFAARDSELAPHLISAIWRISDTELYREGLNAPHVRCVTSAEMERVVAGAPPFLLLYVHP